MCSYHLGTLDGMAPSVHPEAWIAPGVVLVGRVTVGRAASVWYGSVLRADDDEIVVGEECNIQDQCCLHVDSGEPVILAERVSLGHRATVHGAHVEAGALIGIGAIVLGRARVGAGSLVAAGAVVRPGQRIPAGRPRGRCPGPGGARAHRRRPCDVRGHRRQLHAARGPPPGGGLGEARRAAGPVRSRLYRVRGRGTGGLLELLSKELVKPPGDGPGMALLGHAGEPGRVVALYQGSL